MLHTKGWGGGDKANAAVLFKVQWFTATKILVCCIRERMINNEEEEGKGWSAKRPRKRLEFQKFPTVVGLLSLEQWRNAHGANQPDVNHR